MLFNDVELKSGYLDAGAAPITTARVAQVLTNQVVAENLSITDATGLEVTVTVADGFDFLGAESMPAAGAVLDAGPPATVTWTVGALAAGSNATLGIDLVPGFEANDQLLTNSAAVTKLDPPLTNSPKVDADLQVNDASDGLLSGGSGSCFIATAAYGSYLEPEVRILRTFRDEYLLSHAPGRRIVTAYYRYSPPLADAISRSESLRWIFRVLLTPVVYGVKYPLITGLLIMLIGSVTVRARRRPSRVAGAD